jgi:small conductance mechanosensitive channel
MIEITVDSLVDLIAEIAFRLGFAAIWILLGSWLARLAHGWVEKYLSRKSMGWNGTVLLSRLVSVSIQIGGVLLALNMLGISGTGLLAVVSAFTVAVGISLQDVLKNFFAGIYLLLERPFKTGDRIVVRDVVGEVQGVDIRTTMIKNVKNELVLVPNAIIFTDILRNDTHFGIKRVELTIKSETRSLVDIVQRVQAGLEAVDEVRRPIPSPRIVASEPERLTVVISLILDNTDEALNQAAQAVIDALPGDSVEVTLS